ncbi:hypothetical protein FDECE_15468 [Fusarium decemcellulare]|nr:hypothetical protein FDECE_15468 [Fusarium decemcellulare]
MALKLALAVALAVPAWSMPSPADLAQLSNRAAAIVGGQEAKLGEFPFIVSLESNGMASCGGSLLDATTVMTAAHCVYRTQPSDFRVRAGSLHWNSGGKVVNVSAITQHPSYKPLTTDNDIAILRLSSPIYKTSAISYATLPKQGSDPTPKTITTVAGWGYIDVDGDRPKQLMKVSVPVVARQTCQKLYSKAQMTVTNNMWCAGAANGGKNACHGDSGGPIIDKKTGIVIGIVSWSIQCGVAEYPGVYTRVGNYIPFIAEHLSQPYKKEV